MEPNELRNVRLEKLLRLKEAGYNPYATKPQKRTHSIKDALDNFDVLGQDEKKVGIAGRIMSIREHGGSTFGDIYDGSEKIQFYLKKNLLGDESYSFFLKNFDVGDFAEFTGTLFVTHKGEKTLKVDWYSILSKSLLTLPDKWHGIVDDDKRYRKRYLDLLMNPELKKMFERKAKFWGVCRDYFKSKNFFEVETPTLEVTTGGAEATPFATHHNDFDLDVYLRISVGELWQKRLMAAGFEKTFEIGKIYRNEGSSPNHLQEFTNGEFYWAYANFEDGMKLVQELYQKIARDIYGTTKFKTGDYEWDVSGEWPKIDYREEILNKTGLDIKNSTAEEMREKLDELNVKYEGETLERLTDTLWKYCRKKIGGPVFLINHPKLVSPLAKSDPEKPDVVQRFQVIIAGSEAGNGYSELNDPIDQRERFELQQKLIEQGDNEAMMPDWEFCEMLEHGMPPTCGFGWGERLFSFTEDKPIRETTLFPLMKPEWHEKKEEGKSKETLEAVVVINKSLGLEQWQEMNTVAHLSASFSAREGKILFLQDSVTTKDREDLKLNIQHAIMIKAAQSNSEMVEFFKEIKDKKGVKNVVFTREMIETTDDKKVAENTKGKNLKEIEFLGILVFGRKNIIDNLTSIFTLLE